MKEEVMVLLIAEVLMEPSALVVAVMGVAFSRACATLRLAATNDKGVVFKTGYE